MLPTHQPESTAVLYIAFELSAAEWLVTLSAAPGGPRQRRRLRPGDTAALARLVSAAKVRFGLAATAPVRSCYEAGRDGFWPHRWLTRLGVTNLVVDSSSIEVSRRARRAKTDRLDGEKLLRLLQRHWGGEPGVWQVVRVPTPEAEDARHASRGLTTLQAERTRQRNRLRALLTLHGIRDVRIDAQFPMRLRQLRDWAGVALPPGVVARALTTYRVLQENAADNAYGGYYESIMCGPNAFWCNAPPLKGTEHANRRFVIMGFNFERGVGEPGHARAFGRSTAVDIATWRTRLKWTPSRLHCGAARIG